MPQSQMGETLPIDRQGLFIDLKAKGESVTVRFANSNFYYNGKHFNKDENNKWVVTDCPRVNEDAPCDSCDKFFELKRKAKDAKNLGDTLLEKKLNDEARPYGAKTTFYYAVLDRETNKAKILKTTLLIRLKLEEMLKAGVRVLDCDFIVTRTERVGSDYYTLIRVDSAEIKPYDDKALAELEKAKELVLSEIIENAKQSELSLEPASEDIIVPDDFGQAGEGDVKLEDRKDEMPF